MWELVRANRRRSMLLVFGMALLLAAVGYACGTLFLPDSPWGGVVLALILWAILALIARTGGDTLLLSVTRARKIEKEHHPTLYNVVEEMTIASGLPRMPSVYIIDDQAPNAFAAGREPERASVAVTSGLLERLNRDELQGVIAHELAHIKNRDVLFMTTLTVMVGAIVLLAEVGRRMLWFGGRGRRRTSSSGGEGQGAVIIAVVALVLMILAPIFAQLLYLATSRRREYLADASAALFTRYPEGLASALAKIARSTRPMAAANRATAPLFIVNPLKASRSGLADLSSTHPPISERIKILRSMAGGAGLGHYDEAFRKVTGRAVGIVPGAELRPGTDAAVDVRPPVAAEGESARDRVRASSDALWRINNYTFLPCDCGTTLKVPPGYPAPTLACPHCGVNHPVPQDKQK